MSMGSSEFGVGPTRLKGAHLRTDRYQYQSKMEILVDGEVRVDAHTAHKNANDSSHEKNIPETCIHCRQKQLKAQAKAELETSQLDG